MRGVLLAAALSLGLSLPVKAQNATVNAMTASPAITDGQLLYCPILATSDFKCTFTQVFTWIQGHLAAPGAIGGTTPAAGAFTTLAASGQFTSTVTTGTSPFVVASTTNVANLNASSLGGATFAAPGAIGGTTPAGGSFTTLTASGLANFTSTFQIGGNTITWPGVATTVAALNIADQTVTGGANVTSLSLGTITSGTTTLDCGSRPNQSLTNGGAFTLAAPTNDGSCLILVTNNASSASITFTAGTSTGQWSVGSNTGDTYTTGAGTNGQSWTLFVWKIGTRAGYRWAAHQ